MDNDSIGIFDSGVGGISIYKEIHQLLPLENIIYLADSKNAPYGGKTKDQIIEFSVKNTEFLLRKGCKIIVVACNTASTNAVKYLREHYKVSFIRVQPAIKPAAINSITKVVGILATKGTLKSDLLFETSQKFAKGVQIFHQIGEGLVELIESGKIHSYEMDILLNKYLQPLLNKNIDYLVLGCTHYSFLIPQIKKIVRDKVTILDSGEAIARQTKVILGQEKQLNNFNINSKQHFYINKQPLVLQNFLDNFNKDYLAEKIEF